MRLQRFIELAEHNTMEELDKETRKFFTVQSVDVTITLLTGAMKQHVNKQNSSNRQGGFSGFALTATSNGSMNIVMDCECTNHIIPDKSMFMTLSMLEGDGSLMFITNGDGMQQRVHGVGEVCRPFNDHNKAKYTLCG